MVFREGEEAYIIENNSRVTPVHVIRKDGDFYTIEFSNYSRINLRESRLFHTAKEAEGKISRTPLVKRPAAVSRYASPYQYDNGRNPYGI